MDSNVWYWMGYTKASIDAGVKQSDHYPKYLNKILTANGSLYKCTLSFAELAHSIERSERTIFNRSRNPEISTKAFRHDYPEERKKILAEIEDVWNLVEAMTGGNTIEVNLDTSMILKSIERIKSEGLDGYDVFMIEALLAHGGITQVITDDGDFGQVEGITVFTANDYLIKTAKSQKKLVVR